MTLRFRTIEELRKQYSDAQVLEMVSRFLDDREARSGYHKKYNQRKTATLKLIREQHPELFEKAASAVA